MNHTKAHRNVPTFKTFSPLCYIFRVTLQWFSVLPIGAALTPKCVGWVIISSNFLPLPSPFLLERVRSLTHSTLKLYWFLFNLSFPWIFRLGHLSSSSLRFFFCHVKPTSGAFQQNFHFSILTPQPQNFYLVFQKLFLAPYRKISISLTSL